MPARIDIMLENLREFADESLPRKALVNTRETSTNTRDFARTKSTRGFPFPRREQKRPNGSRPYSYSARTPKVSLYRNLPKPYWITVKILPLAKN
ncbi:MAG: hypothetical protein AUG17_04640 [Crenarchaeota archaeon 13_1_20CM_2_53_14]|nr:MAG: hypothetical protein AUI07_09160 [archaeon 13_2_20CM_2_53_6]OLE59026.1 MAG: hypothetical protein AUG17_04640 [Crenarchaeota archaeon 13_1_20CM_2_53_14]